MHRLLAMNIDGTVLQSNGKLQKSVKEAVDYVQNKGVQVTLFTSRNFIYAKRIAKALKIDSLIVAHHGAFIASSVEQPLFVKRLEENIVYDLVRFLESFTCHIRIVHEKYSVSNKPLQQKGLTGRAVIDTTSFSVYNHQFVQNLSEYVFGENIEPTHMEVVFTNKLEAEEAQVAIRGMFYEVDTYQYGNQLIILPNSVSKLSGLLYAGDYFDIPLQDMVAIGSGMDDLDVIEAVGLGVAMGNAPTTVKAAANWVTRSNNQHGVAYMVREHFRKQQPLDFIEKLNSMK
ncbi:HAD-IIB family hydrolase [Caldibacillus lycopersici]|uniref:HAD-IIB family hydrolase n=1 Tax=Perspicuibacillus lycopersici TaxID=1325689 RepID=A0AAE3ISB7_9BACI|nr:HAD-IIB family hydrolase [Perspicuibacillus lycopersici]MCU9612529.1 HAD-IIB family hydrolase [Perspicuibacillus lycopersici]